MSRLEALKQIILSRLREFYREPAAIFWVYVFPLLLAVGLSIAFSNKPPKPVRVDVVAGPQSPMFSKILTENGVISEVHDLAEAQRRYRIGKSDIYVTVEENGLQFGIDPTRDESPPARYKTEAVYRQWQSPSQGEMREKVEKEPGNRYIDFLMPGLIGLNLMGGGMWGIGFVLVDMRVRKLLKRLLATPMRRGDFLIGMLVARLMLLLPEMLVLALVAHYGFDVPLRGNMITLILVMLFASLAFSGIGLLMASRTEKTETVTGLMNLIMLPQWLLSGVFFSAKNFPNEVQPLIQALPLTQVNDALREVALEGRSLTDIAWRLLILAAYAVVSFFVALRIFRWS
jgi:ABC-type multidrug transport system permease subunit